MSREAAVIALSAALAKVPLLVRLDNTREGAAVFQADYSRRADRLLAVIESDPKVKGPLAAWLRGKP